MPPAALAPGWPAMVAVAYESTASRIRATSGPRSAEKKVSPPAASMKKAVILRIIISEIPYCTGDNADPGLFQDCFVAR